MDLPKHGSNPKYLYQKMNLAIPEELIDFSVNLNPWGPPIKIFAQWDQWKNEIIDYPDPLGQELKIKISNKENLNLDQILLGNGAAELIQLLAIHFREQKIGIFQPTFSEYERMTSAYDAKISYLSLDQLSKTSYIKEVTQEQVAIFLCQPNNPTGETLSQRSLDKLLKECEKNNCYLIIDEAFYDFSLASHSMVSSIKSSQYLIILRSATKMYSIAGIRLGYLFASAELVNSLRAYQSYWSVNALALKMGEILIEEEEFVIETQLKIAKIRNHIFPLLEELGFLLSDSQVNFFLLRDPQLKRQKELMVFLLKKGIVPRHTENYPGLDGNWLRFAIRPFAEMNQLLEALEEWKRN